MPEPALLALAREKFGALSDAEEELFRAAQEGRSASALSRDKRENNPSDAVNWDADRVVRAKCISWVCTDPQASALVSYRGLELQGMRIDGWLDLGSADIQFPFWAWKCAFSEDISLQDAQLRGFSLLDCRIKGLNANGASIEDDVFVRGGCKTEGEVDLLGAKIGGNLDCSGAQFSNVGGLALIASGAQIRGPVFLSDGFKAEGEVNLVGTKIGGILDCKDAEFSNVKGMALNASAARVDGSVFLRGSKAEGEVNLLRTAINGNLDCSGARFFNATGLALTVEGAQIESNVFLCDGFKAEGKVNLMGATIDTLLIRGVLEAKQTTFDLRLTQVKTFWDDEKSWPGAGSLFLDGFRYERLYEDAPFEANKRKKWLSLQPRDRFRPQPYEQLAAVLRQMGHERDARQVMIEKNRERARLTRFRQQGWWWYNLLGRLIGYGYAPWRAFAMSLGMILLGYFLFYLGSTHDLISPANDYAYAKAPNGQVILEDGGKKISEEYPVFHSFYYSLESFTPLLKLDQSAHWRPNANHGAEIPLFRFWAPRTGELLRYYLYFHIAAGWVLTSLWVGAITGLVKT